MQEKVWGCICIAKPASPNARWISQEWLALLDLRGTKTTIIQFVMDDNVVVRI